MSVALVLKASKWFREDFFFFLSQASLFSQCSVQAFK